MNIITMLGRVIWLLAAALALTAAVLATLWFLGRPAREVQGIWETEGYGLVFDISPFTIRILQVGPASCTIWKTMPAHRGMAKRFAGYGFSAVGAGSVMQISAADVTNPITATRLDALPAQCTEGKPAGPVENFDIFWHAFDQHYPHFETQGIDWDARRDEALTELGDPPDRDPRTLAAVMRHALDGITDPQVSLDTPDGTYRPARGIEEEVPAWVEKARAALPVIDSYLDPEPQNTETGGFRHAWIDGEIAYLGLHHMETQAALSGTQADEAAALAALMAETYADAKGVIVDLRFNPGGAETVALEYARLFASEARIVAQKSVVTGPDSLSPPTPIRIRPTEASFGAIPTVVLTSAHTGGAAELFTLAVRDEPQVTVMGEETAGALSDLLTRTLPNGFSVTLPHQVYATAEGTPIGLTPLAPDLSVADGNGNAGDAVLEAAIDVLE
ncbi:S41 family peptidase [Celeribacter sp.]|uniref:S41 family peptidase n=1 Tax=Celeribacter sp. TaxID=1890673 RepID=UPI003A944769